MSAPLKLDAGQLLRLSRALNLFTAVAKDHAVYVHGPGGVQWIEIDGTFLEILWDDEKRCYRLNDWVGQS